MPFNPRDHFRKACNKKRVHIEQLRLIRDQASTDKTTRRRLQNKITYERQQLAVLSEIWDVQ
jgi:hypothetical protein